jgi:hypothetical protein
MSLPRTFLDVRHVTISEPRIVSTRRVNFHPWSRGPFGVLVHTTGHGPAKLARLKGWSIAATVARVYGNTSQTLAHIAILPSGERVRCVADSLVAPHCGVTAAQRAMLLNGTWRAHVSDEGEALWEKRWPGVKSPQHLFPTTSPNDAYLGIETVQLEANDPATGTRFTVAQYESTAEQIVIWERAYGWKAEGRRLVTHEDVQPFTRWDDGGGWDPGVLRAVPRYDWDRLLSQIRLARAVTP